MKTLTCGCGELYHVGDGPPGGKILCRSCRRVLSIDDAVETRGAPKARKSSTIRQRRDTLIVPVAPARWTRVGAWWGRVAERLTEPFRRPHGPAGRPAGLGIRALRLVTVAATLLALALWAFLHWQSDRSGVGMLLAFGPRWWLTLPWIALLIAAGVAGWRSLVLGSVGAAVTVFGIAGFELPPWRRAPETPRALRIVTYNTDGSTTLPWRIRRDLERWTADVAVFQDCTPGLSDSLRALGQASMHAASNFCMVSKWPTLELDSLAVPAGRNIAYRYRLQSPAGVLTVYSVHLSSPRTALWGARNLMFTELQRSVEQRARESRALTRWVNRVDRSSVVVGDFNLPDGSGILRDGWSDLTDAWEAIGAGFGHTMKAGRFTVRIDHALNASALVPTDIRVERGFPTEHRPLIVEYRWRDPLAISAATARQ
jgi:endonuclease/exonuclease/phosphatase (EEP) superfamily protein YafD